MSLENNNTAVMVFTKFPAEGKVKTRLAKDMSSRFAASFFKVCAEHTFDELLKVKRAGVDVFLFCPEDNEIDKVIEWTGNNFIYYSQHGSDLGIKMYNAFFTVFNKGYEKVIIVGTDSPDISSKIIQNAISLLENYDVVIGPANDGGYYLLGLKSKLVDLFSGIKWSTKSVLDNTIEKLNNSELNYYMLDELTDIDTKEDLHYWLKNSKCNSSHPIKLFLESYDQKF